MMDQFNRAKKEQPDALLFFRMGDFYELFGQDAQIAGKELGIAVTSRAKGADALPMAGVPVKSMEGYLLRLVRKGHKVAICEQMSDPRTTKGIVDRAIVRVVTAGTLTEESALESNSNNYLASLYPQDGKVGLAWVDLSTGRFQVSEVPAAKALDELNRIAPAELLWAEEFGNDHPELAAALIKEIGPALSERAAWRFSRDTALRALHEQFQVKSLEGYGLEDDSAVVPAAGALIEYLEETQRGRCEHILSIETTDHNQWMTLDRATRSCLELCVTQRDGHRAGSLLSVIDQTLTPMGGRLQREWLLAPLREVEAILYRQRGVAEMVDHPFLREDVRALLREVLDIERLVAKISTGRATPRDLLGLASSLAIVAPLRERTEGVYSKAWGSLYERLDPLKDLVQELQQTLVDSPPTSMRDGGLIRKGVSAELDELRQIAGDGKAWMARFQAEEIERTGMSNLKIGYTAVFGYYLEVPRGQVDRVPETYIRKQTLKNAERYITPELKEFEDKVLKAEERSKDLEYDMFLILREKAAAAVPRILATARALAECDVLSGLAETAALGRYAAPEINNGATIDIREGRHPVIEAILEGEPFVPNDTLLDQTNHRVGLITGPNMAGKSTYIRQTALIVLLAQIGSFVPAQEATIGVVDRIFTRLGSADDLSRGASTFMVEMIEIANILNNAKQSSLVILDEVGRGTSTYDGLALAWAIVEHLHDTAHARTLFATHYHQLTELADSRKGVHNLNIAVREKGDEIVFLHKIVAGGTDRSYGIQVARLAGVPKGLVQRAKEILGELEAHPTAAGNEDTSTIKTPTGGLQLALFEGLGTPQEPTKPSVVEERVRELELDHMTPWQAMETLRELKSKLNSTKD
ncbi:MAG: DNA mismatch repair protein MutS [Planctomycetes bacterium]|nr:DNA mismatch repair protein MutS [Planctomycetota bacterium]